MNTAIQNSTTKPKAKARKATPTETSLQIRFNGSLYNIRENKDGLFSLTDIEKAWIESGGEGGRLDHWKANPEITQMLSVPEIRVVSNGGGSGPNKGTWGCERAVTLYASYCDIRFNLVVVDAFNLLTKGRYEEALAKANWSVKRKDTKFYFRKVTDSLKDTAKNPTPYIYSNESKMICKIMGIPTGERDYLSAQQLEQLAYLEMADTILIDAGQNFQERKVKLKEMFDKKFPKH